MKPASAPLYIRFGAVPENESSQIYASDEAIGVEAGVSVYRAVEANGVYFPLLPEDANADGIADYFGLLLGRKRKIYLVTGDELRVEGKGREPLLRNIVVLKEITDWYSPENLW